MTDFKTIPLSEIKPDPNQPRKFFNEAALAELIDSVREKGILQPILVRPNGKGYIVVCGERRYKAALSVNAAFKDRNAIPAVVRTLTDEEALEIQFIENIQRDNVHPMDEASTFKQMLENKTHPYTMADIAAKINKPESYVAHRLALNNLIPELQKDFWAGKFLIGHAILFARLAQEDQKTVAKDCKDYWNRNDYKSLAEIKKYIETNVMHALSSAPFKKDDATLNPEMGPCTTCSFRSGSSPSLFNDIIEKDRCFKPACYQIKITNHLQKTIEEVVVEEPETVYLYENYTDIPKNIKTLLEKDGIKPLSNHSDFSTYIPKGAKKTKGIWINGSRSGNIQYVSLENKAVKHEKAADGKPTTSALDAEIEGIKQRTKRAAELDDEKVWRRIHDEVIRGNKLINDQGLSSIDRAALLYGMCKSAGYNGFDKIGKFFGSSDRKKLASLVLNATPAQFNYAVRLFIKEVLDSTTSSHTADAGQGLLKLVADQYHKDSIEAIEAEQKAKRVKREERAQQRIKALQEQKKLLTEKPKAAPKKEGGRFKPAAKKSAPKKAAKKK